MIMSVKLSSEGKLSFYVHYVNKVFNESIATFYWHLLTTDTFHLAILTLQFVGKLPTNCLSVLGHFVKLVLKVLKWNTKALVKNSAAAALTAPT